MYKVAICAIVKNEHDYLLEWIAYHRVIGVDHFLIYNNSAVDDDGTTALLARLEDAGIISLVAWPNQSEWRLPDDVYLSPQIPAYYDGIDRLRGNAEWVAFIDVDEFIVPMRETNLPASLEFYRQYGAVGLNWKMFGSSGERVKRDAPVCERFVRASTHQCGANFHVKSIVRPELIRTINVHRPFLHEGLVVDEHGREITDWRGLHDAVSYDVLRVNHYYTKSREEWMRKAARGRADHPQKKLEESFRDTDFNDEHDSFILKFYDATVREMRGLAKAAKIHGYRGMGAAAPRLTSRNARRLNAWVGRPSALRGSKADPLPILDVRPRGSLGARMLQYLVAQRIGSEAGGCLISGVELPDWGISCPRLPGAPGEPLEEPRMGHRIDIARTARLLSLGAKHRLSLVSGAQWLSNLPDLEVCRGLFPAEEEEYPGYGAEHLVCLLEFPDEREWHGTLLPADFYAEVADSEGLKLVFLTEREENGYLRMLRRRFPEAKFVKTASAKESFQIFRNSRFLIPGVGLDAWLAAWLSQAERIDLPVNGLFHPVQEPSVDLLPLGDERYRFHLFPINFAVSPDRFEESHAALEGTWRLADTDELAALRVPRRVRLLGDFAPFFDEAFYLRRYPDIAAAVSGGGLKSGLDHYAGVGFVEGRSGFDFNLRWYSMAYPDAACEVSEGEYADLIHHYVAEGAGRGYRPVPPEQPSA